MNLLFICKFNRYRSNVALAFFNKINKNKKIQARASGIIEGPPTTKKMEKIAEKFDIKLKNKSTPLDEYLFNWADIVIIIGSDIPKKIFEEVEEKDRKVIIWKLKDIMQFDKNYQKKTTKLTETIMKRVKKLVKELEK